MKQSNLFDSFNRSKKKEQPSSQGSAPAVSTASESSSIIDSNAMALEGVPKETTIVTTTVVETIINENSSDNPRPKKRKNNALALSGVEEESKGTIAFQTDLESIENSVKQVKLDGDYTQSSTRVTVNLQKNPPKDLSQLKKLNHLEYNAYTDAPFWPLENVPFSFLVDCFEEVSTIKGENSKDKMTEIIANMLRSILILNPDQLALAYYFCILKISADYEANNELGIGNEILVKSIARATGRTDKFIKDSANQTGDLGKVAATSKASQSTMEKFMKKTDKKGPISLKQIYDAFKKMASLKGNNSNTERESTLVKLLMDSKDNEPKYIVRFVQKNLKIGAAEATMQAALVRAFLVRNYFDETGPKKKTKAWSAIIPDYEAKLQKYEEAAKRAVCEFPNYELLIRGLTQVGKDIDSLKDVCKITPGIPVKPMLAKPTKGIDIILQRFEGMKFTCEYKYDGLRGQIHYNNGKCEIFSRNLENMTETYPDIVEFVLSSTKPDVKNFIIDSEIVAVNVQTQRILPFQTLSTRSRKNVDKNAIEIQVCLYVFDILYFNDESLLKTAFVDRRKYIKEHFVEVDNKLKFAEHLDADTFEEIQEFLNQSVKVGCEGLMIKTLDVNSTYEPSKRSFKWLKLKKDYIDNGLGDSLDLVPIGAIYGTGKRGGLYGSYLLACYNPDMERYETFCKSATGFSDEDLINFHEFFSKHIIKAPLPEYKVKMEGIDVWFEPCVVWEIRGADIQISPVHTAAIGEVDSNRGLGLRFPRLIKVRDDKKPIEATDHNMIVDMYKSQAAIMNNKQTKFDDDEDMY